MASAWGLLTVERHDILPPLKNKSLSL